MEAAVKERKPGVALELEAAAVMAGHRAPGLGAGLRRATGWWLKHWQQYAGAGFQWR